MYEQKNKWINERMNNQTIGLRRMNKQMTEWINERMNNDTLWRMKIFFSPNKNNVFQFGISNVYDKSKSGQRPH